MLESMDTDAKIAIAKEKKDAADQAFKNGEVVNGMVCHTVSHVLSEVVR